MAAGDQPLRFQGPDGLELTGWHRAAQPEPPDEDAEPGRPGALVFLPGNGFPVQAYAPALAELPPHVAVHALNHRGHGGSALPERLENWDGLAADLRAYVQQRLDAPPILAGHSMGAMVALRVAAESPELCAGLLMLEPPLRLEPGHVMTETEAEQRRQFIDRARGRRDRWESREGAAAWFAGSVLYRLWDPACRAAFVEHGLVEHPEGGVTLATPAWLEAAFYETVPQLELYGWAAAVRCAAVLYRGLHSPVPSLPAYEALVAALRIGVMLPVPGTHAFPLEHPRETGQRLADGVRMLRGETGLRLTPARTASTG